MAREGVEGKGNTGGRTRKGTRREQGERRNISEMNLHRHLVWTSGGEESDGDFYPKNTAEDCFQYCCHTYSNQLEDCSEIKKVPLIRH